MQACIAEHCKNFEESKRGKVLMHLSSSSADRLLLPRAEGPHAWRWLKLRVVRVYFLLFSLVSLSLKGRQSNLRQPIPNYVGFDVARFVMFSNGRCRLFVAPMKDETLSSGLTSGPALRLRLRPTSTYS